MLFDKLRQIEERSHEHRSPLSDPAIFGQPGRVRPRRKEPPSSQRDRRAVQPTTATCCAASRGPAHPGRGRRPRDARDGPGRDRRAAGAADRARGGAAARCSCRAIPTTTRTSSSRSAPAPAATRPRCSPPTSSACTRKYAERQRWKVEIMDSQRHRRRRLQGSHPVRPGPGRVEPAQVRARRAPRAARARHRGERPHPHLDGDRRGAARGRGRRHQDRGEGHPRRRLPLVGAGRPGRQHDGLRGAHHAPADRPGRDLPGRALADQEPREGHARAQGAAARAGAGRAGGGHRRDRREPGRHRRAQRADPHLQLPAGSRHRSPDRAHAAPAARRCSRAISTS